MRYLFFLLLLLLTTPNLSFAQKVSKIDSLKQKLSVVPDSTQIKVLLDLCWAYRNSNIDTAILYANTALEKSIHLNLKTLQPKNYIYLGVLYRNQGDYNQALKYYFLAIRISEEIKNYEQLGYAFQSIGDINNRQGDYEEAIKFTQQGLTQFNLTKDLRGQAYCVYTLGNIYYNKKEYATALEFQLKALEIRKKIKDKSNIASSLAAVAAVLYKQNKRQEALQYANESETLFKETNDLRALANMLNQIASITFDEQKYDTCISKSQEALRTAQKSGNIEYMKDSYWNLYRAYQSLHASKMAFESQKLYLLYEDSLLNQERNRQTVNLESKYKQEKQNLQLQVLKNEEESNKLLFSILGIVSLFLLILAILAFVMNGKRKKNILLLTEQSEEIISKKEVLEQTLSDIHSKELHIHNTINYALRIQTAILLSENNLQQFIPESFILFMPRDTVSGDFYWFTEKMEDNCKRIILIVADCTGHGVPGAFMSMIGDALLNQIIEYKKIFKPHLILNALDNGIRTALRQNETARNDGMDISVVTFIHNAQKQLIRVGFAGAMNPAYIVEHQENNNLLVLRPNKRPIGGSSNLYRRKNAEIEQFTKTAFEVNASNKVKGENYLQTPFTLYMCSDGFQDQFGGNNDRKFMTNQFKLLLQKISTLPIQKQKEELQTVYQNWKQSKKQTDDITILGIKIT